LTSTSTGSLSKSLNGSRCVGPGHIGSSSNNHNNNRTNIITTNININNHSSNNLCQHGGRRRKHSLHRYHGNTLPGAWTAVDAASRTKVAPRVQDPCDGAVRRGRTCSLLHPKTSGASGALEAPSRAQTPGLLLQLQAWQAPPQQAPFLLRRFPLPAFRRPSRRAPPPSPLDGQIYSLDSTALGEALLPVLLLLPLQTHGVHRFHHHHHSHCHQSRAQTGVFLPKAIPRMRLRLSALHARQFCNSFAADLHFRWLPRWSLVYNNNSTALQHCLPSLAR